MSQILIDSGRYPVLLGHGLFQHPGNFVLNKENSLAFALVEQGYDVWMGNKRATSTLDHVSLSHKDPEYWAWGLKELSLYDLISAIDFVCEQIGFAKVAYIGHSQGNAQAFIALTIRPDVASKFSCFIALAPAIFAGTLVSKFPLKQLIGMNQRMYRLIFGNSGFLPVMSFAQEICNPVIFSQLAYSMFSYLFAWRDTHWLPRRKVKYFQFTPRPVSAQLITDWLDGWGKLGVCKYVTGPLFLTTTAANHENVKMSMPRIPFAAFYGTDDFLIDGDRFIATFEEDVDSYKKSDLFPMLNLVHVERVSEYEHMDTIWAHNSHITTYPGIYTLSGK